MSKQDDREELTTKIMCLLDGRQSDVVLPSLFITLNTTIALVLDQSEDEEDLGSHYDSSIRSIRILDDAVVDNYREKRAELREVKK